MQRVVSSSSPSESSSRRNPLHDFGLRRSAGFTGSGRLTTGGEELGGYVIGEDADGILEFGGEDGGGKLSDFGRGRKGVSSAFRIFSSILITW